jgi:quercetin dioxygenase-like cupin family protein
MQSNNMQEDNGELEKGKPHVVVEIIDYVQNAVVSKTIIRKTTGNVTALSFDQGEEQGEKITPFDTFVQIIDGKAEITIENNKHELHLGTGIIIPAHKLHYINAFEKFKMISTVIKSGYENVAPGYSM